MSEFGGLWKHQTNSVCIKSKSVSFQSVEVGHFTEEKEEEYNLFFSLTGTSDLQK